MNPYHQSKGFDPSQLITPKKARVRFKFEKSSHSGVNVIDSVQKKPAKPKKLSKRKVLQNPKTRIVYYH